MVAKRRKPLKMAVWPLVILAVALILRIIYLWTYQGMPDWFQLTVDNNYHLNWANDIAGGNLLGDTTYFRAPFYVYALALLFSVFGSSIWIGRLFGLVVGLASIFMTYRLGRRFFSERTGLIAAMLHAVYPVTMYFESELLLDPLFLLLLQVAVYRTAIWIESGHLKDSLWVGLTIGLASITRPTALVMIPIAVAVILIYRRQWRNGLRQFGLLVLGVGLMIAPITVRNLVVAGDPVQIASQGGINLFLGNNDAADGLSAVMPEPLGYNWQIRDITYIAEQHIGRPLKPGEVSGYWASEAITWMLDNPGQCAKLYVSKLYHAICNREISNNRDLGLFFNSVALLRLNPLSFGLIFALACLGIVAGVRRNRQTRLLVGLILIYTAAASLFFFNSRFRLPLLPFYFLLAATGLEFVRHQWQTRSGSLLPGVLTAVVAGVVSYVPLVALPSGSSPQALMSRALFLYERGEYQASLSVAREAAAIDPTFTDVNLTIGNAYLRLGDGAAAAQYYGRDTLYHPGRARAYSNLASLRLLEGRPEAAVSLCNRSIALRPYDVTANQILLRSLFAVDTLQSAALVKAGADAATRTGNDGHLLAEFGGLLSRRHLESDAEAVLRKAINSVPPPIETDDEAFSRTFRNAEDRLDQQKAGAAFQLGFLLGRNGRFEESIRYSRLAIELDPNLAEAWVNLITGYISAGQPDRADSSLTEALARFPDNPSLHQLLEFRQ